MAVVVVVAVWTQFNSTQPRNARWFTSSVTQFQVSSKFSFLNIRSMNWRDILDENVKRTTQHWKSGRLRTLTNIFSTDLWPTRICETNPKDPCNIPCVCARFKDWRGGTTLSSFKSLHNIQYGFFFRWATWDWLIVVFFSDTCKSFWHLKLHGKVEKEWHTTLVPHGASLLNL